MQEKSNKLSLVFPKIKNIPAIKDIFDDMHKNIFN